MASYTAVDNNLRELVEDRFKVYEAELIRRKAVDERDAKVLKAREKRKREFLASVGTDLKKLDAATEAEKKSQEADLRAFLAEYRGEGINRHSRAGTIAKDAATRGAVMAESGHLVLPPYASTLFTADKSLFKDVVGLDWTDGEINSGWVFPDDPSKIRIKDTRHYPNALCWDNRQDLPPEFSINFTFTPATTATYGMTAIVAFDGFYVLRCDDSWWNCRAVSVKLTAQMNVHQYTDSGWEDFTFLDIEKQNTEEVTSYDRTQFMDYTTGLRGGDPVVVTVKGVVEASAHGGGAYAELNFMDGTANYIWPLFLSVQQV